MDGGIDSCYRQFFGASLESKIRDLILQGSEQSLPVGSSLLVLTGNPSIPYMIVAATMEMPEHVPPENAYSSMRAVLRIAHRNPDVAERIYCPGLTTGVGRVEPLDAAMQMAEAYRDWLKSA